MQASNSETVWTQDTFLSVTQGQHYVHYCLESPEIPFPHNQSRDRLCAKLTLNHTELSATSLHRSSKQPTCKPSTKHSPPIFDIPSCYGFFFSSFWIWSSDVQVTSTLVVSGLGFFPIIHSVCMTLGKGKGGKNTCLLFVRALVSVS